MRQLPDDLNQSFSQMLISKSLRKPEQYFCSKWLRYYWDFCHKYHHNPFLPESLPLFLAKLQEKKQTEQQQNQARFAIHILYEMNSLALDQQNSIPENSHSSLIQKKGKRSNNQWVVNDTTPSCPYGSIA